MPLDTEILLTLGATLTKALDLNIPESVLRFVKEIRLANGTDADEADKIFHDRRTLVASDSEEHDLAGGLTDAFGDVITLARMKVLLIYADPANVNDVVVGGAAANALVTPFGDPTDKVKVRPGGLLILVAPDVVAYGITAATADLLKVANGGGGTSVTYDIVIIGTTV
jgi:hypothetical protein